MDVRQLAVSSIISAVIAPALLLGAVGMQMRVLNNRLSRIVDRRRWLVQQAEEAELADERAEEARILLQRRNAIYLAFLSAGTAGLLTCCLVAVAFLGVVLNEMPERVIVALFVTAMAAQVASYLFFLHEIVVSIRSITLTIRGLRPRQKS